MSAGQPDLIDYKGTVLLVYGSPSVEPSVLEPGVFRKAIRIDVTSVAFLN